MEENVEKTPEQRAAEARRILMTTNAVKTADKPATPQDKFEEQLRNLIRDKQRLGWNPRRIKRYVKENFNINVQF